MRHRGPRGARLTASGDAALFPGNRSLIAGLGILACELGLIGTALCDDWPTWRHDARRSAASPQGLPERLHLQWMRPLPPLTPAWPDQPRLRFDAAYEPIVAGKTLFFGSPAADCLTALDTETGAERWRFYADGPVRFAPVAWRGKVYFACDDGHLYCLEAATGRLLWRFRGGPPDRAVLGNGRLISLWPARGAPAIAHGTLYFAAGIWPFQGVFLHALDPETGEVVWTNDGAGAAYMLQPHHSPAFSGVAPQGYLAAAGDRLLVPCGRAVPACFERATGKLLYFELADNGRTGGFLVAANRDRFANGDWLFDLDEGKAELRVGPAPIMTDDVVYASDHHKLTALRLGAANAGGLSARTVPRLWRFHACGPAFIKAGWRLYAGGRHIVQAIDIPPTTGPLASSRHPLAVPGRQPRVSWQSRIAGTPATMLAADDKLFVVTLEGHLYCFGARPASVPMPQPVEDALVACNADWRYAADGPATDGAWRTIGFDDRSWASGPSDVGSDDEDDSATSWFGSWSRRKPSPTCFRRVFQVAPGARYKALRLEVTADSGAVVYLNGTEVFRTRVAASFSSYSGLDDEDDDDPGDPDGRLELDPGLLAPGRNVVAVELPEPRGFRRGSGFVLELGAAKPTPQPKPTPAPRPQDEWTQRASDILKRSGVTDGYGLVLGLGTGRLAEELVRQSRLRLVAIDPDAAKVDAARRRLDAEGLYGARLAILVGDPRSFPFPPYFASLIVSEDLDAGGFGTGPGFAARVYRSLRPYGGVACLPIPEGEHEAFARPVAEASLASLPLPRGEGRGEGASRAEVRREGGLTLLTRVGPLPGAADWTHQYADAANTAVSRDDLVRAPLGILWFGGITHDAVLPRHGHGPSEQIAGGRLIIEGPDSLRATDVYTGRLLWQASLPGLGDAYNNTSHQPGANAIGSNYLSTPDGIYVAYGTVCLRLDPATGRRLAEFTLPPLQAGSGAPTWGYLNVAGDVLLAGATAPRFEADADFAADEFSQHKRPELDAIARWLGRLPGYSPAPRREGESKVDALVSNLNALVALPTLASLAPRRGSPSGKAEAIRQAIASHLKESASRQDDGRELKRLNRMLLEELCPALPGKRVVTGGWNVYSGSSSKWLVAMDRHSGKVLWTRQAANGFLHNAIAIGGGKVFCIDRLPEGVLRARRWRGETAPALSRLMALDLHSGSVLWSAADGVFGSWLAYSAEHDILLEAARASRDMLPEPGKRMAAHRASDGSVLWDQPHRYTGPCMLRGDTIITQEKAFDLLTGKPRTRTDPLTGEEVPWRFERNYGCNTIIASQHLLTFRSAAAGYYDLDTDGGTANLGGFRSGCTSNLLAADGVLNAPDYTRTCTCSYPNQTSLALVHDPEVESWTFTALKATEARIRRLGINLGAPGDRLADDGTLWLDYPSVGGHSPDVPVTLKPERIAGNPPPDLFCHHSSWVRGEGLKWVAASGARGIRSLTVSLSGEVRKWRRLHPTLLSRWMAGGRIAGNPPPDLPPKPYTVRLHFVEPDGAAPGERVFNVWLQGKRAVEGLDIAREAGGPARPLALEFKGVDVADDLKVSLAPVWGRRTREPVLCGVEVAAEGW